jgi:hypothetical protein
VAQNLIGRILTAKSYMKKVRMRSNFGLAQIINGGIPPVEN